mgnify:CR=1 FL=1
MKKYHILSLCIPRNTISLLNYTVSDIHNFSVAYYMKHYPTKCKEMLINFLYNDNFILTPVVIADNTIECVLSIRS